MTSAVLQRVAPEALIDRPARAARATLRDDLVDEYAAALQDGAELPPPTAFTDGAAYWLADGRHRVAAHQQAFPGEPMAVAVREGTELDALRVAMTANARHGLRRSPEDLRAAYQAAVLHLSVDATDPQAVAAVLGCSRSAAFNLTAPARADAKARRDRQIHELRAAGTTQAEIAERTGVPQQTVGRVTQKSTVEKRVEPAADPAPAPSNEGQKTGSPSPARRRSTPDRPNSPAPAGAASTLDQLARSVRVLSAMDARRVAGSLPAASRTRVRQAVVDLARWCEAFLAVDSAAPAASTCPRCDGAGCRWCGGQGARHG